MYNTQYSDIYFSTNAIAESEYVFIRGCCVPTRFYTKNNIRIAETGFGTGRNLLCSIMPSTQHKKQCFLEYYSVEHNILTIQQIKKILAPHIPPAYHELFLHYQTCYPKKWQKGWNCFHIQWNTIHATVYIYNGDVQNYISSLLAHNIQMDCWYLDGHNPHKNPAMWHDSILHTLPHLLDKYGSISTYTAVGFIKRSLQNAHLHVWRIHGFGNKRHMLIATHV